MTRDSQIALVKRYFDAVDGEDLPALLDTLTPDCVFSVETHGVCLNGHSEISNMFNKLWADHKKVLHHEFTHVPDPETGHIASRFTVQNTETDGSLTYKSNCNFFEIRGGALCLCTGLHDRAEHAEGHDMTDDALIELAVRYFTALDARDPEALADTLAADCVMTIETHGITYAGRSAIKDLFATRWQASLRAVHHDFTHSPSAVTGRIASQFTVTYTGPGASEPKSNANVFAMQNGEITKIAVYMAGANTIQT